MPNKEMRAAVEEFILQRINICGAHESPGLQTARERFKLCIEKLNQTLSDQQNSLYRECENTYALVDGETMQCYGIPTSSYMSTCGQGYRFFGFPVDKLLEACRYSRERMKSHEGR